jgi:hypothetical protein
MFRKLIILAILGIGVPHAQAADEIIVDNRDSNTTSSGTWRISAAKGFYGVDSVYSYPGAVFTWIPTMPTAGDYDVFVRWTYYSTRGTNVPYTLFHAGADSPFITTVNQKDRATAGDWFPIGRFAFDAGPNRITVSGKNGQASADAVRFVYAGEPWIEIGIESDWHHVGDGTGFASFVIPDAEGIYWEKEFLLKEHHIRSRNSAFLAFYLLDTDEQYDSVSINGFSIALPGSDANKDRVPFIKKTLIAFPIGILHGGENYIRFEATRLNNLQSGNTHDDFEFGDVVLILSR